MFRTLLAAYLSLAMALGPALCCCTFREISSLLTGTWDSAVCCTSHSRPHSHSHAEGHDHAGGSHSQHHSMDAPKQESTPSAPAPVKEECPCHQHDQIVLASSLNESGTQLSVGHRLDVREIFVVQPLSLNSADGLGQFLLLSRQDNQLAWVGRDILRACSTLRC